MITYLSLKTYVPGDDQDSVMVGVVVLGAVN
jgi:hypothetical protein